MHNLKWNLDDALNARFLDGLEEGIEKGGNLKAEAVALKMLRKGKSFDEVHEFTDIPILRLEQLAHDNRNDT